MSSARVHPTAIVAPTVRLADDVLVGPYAVLEGEIELNRGCVVKPHVHLIGPLVVGPDNTFCSGAVIGERPQHQKFDGPPTGVVIGAGNVVREHVTIHSGSTDVGTRIGDQNYFMAAAHVAHDCIVGHRCILANGALLGGHCEVGDAAFLSGNCAAHQFSRIGRLSMMSGGATTSKDVPPFFVQEGRNRVVGVNVVGMRRAGLKSDQIDAIREAYRILYLQRMVVPAAVEHIERQLGHVDTVAELVEFIRASKRGITSTSGYTEAA
jgi:UDP-N-acetylglucosamine acyltransferase